MGECKIPASKDLEMASVIRNTVKFKGGLLRLDPWLPFPQNSCSYSFGNEGRPLPIGALFILWDKWPKFTGPCPACGGTAFGYGFGGLFSIGGVNGRCSVCGSLFGGSVGGLSQIGNLIRPMLAETPYFLKGSMFGGVYSGPRAPLVNALRQLGASDLPGDEWVLGSEPSSVSFTVDLGKNESDEKEQFDGGTLFHRILWVVGVGLILAALRHGGSFLSHLM